MRNRKRGAITVTGIVLCVVLVLLAAVGYKEFGKWKKKADTQKAIATAAETAKAKADADERAERAKVDADTALRIADLQTYTNETTAMDKAFQEFLDAKAVAHSISRIGLATPVLTLQASRRKFLEIPVGKCLEGAKLTLAASMASAVSGFTTFMSNEHTTGAYDAGPHFEKSTTLRNAGVLEMVPGMP